MIEMATEFSVSGSIVAVAYLPLDATMTEVSEVNRLPIKMKLLTNLMFAGCY